MALPRTANRGRRIHRSGLSLSGPAEPRDELRRDLLGLGAMAVTADRTDNPMPSERIARPGAPGCRPRGAAGAAIAVTGPEGGAPRGGDAARLHFPLIPPAVVFTAPPRRAHPTQGAGPPANCSL